MLNFSTIMCNFVQLLGFFFGPFKKGNQERNQAFVLFWILADNFCSNLD